MKVEDIKTVGVVGAGTMGSGIAQVAAVSGFNVILQDISEEALQRGLNIVKKSLGRMVKKEKISQEEADQIMGRIRTTLSLEDMREADIVIEAVFEKMDLKKEVFGTLDRITRKEIILATNTSSLFIPHPPILKIYINLHIMPHMIVKHPLAVNCYRKLLGRYKAC